MTQSGPYQTFDPTNMPLMTDIHSATTNPSDGFYRGLAMVLSPMDGVVDWEMEILHT